MSTELTQLLEYDYPSESLYKELGLGTKTSSHQKKRTLIEKKEGHVVLKFIEQTVNPIDDSVFLISTSTKFNIDQLPENSHSHLINLEKINEVSHLNRFLTTINTKLPIGGVYISCAETYSIRRKRVMNRFRFPFNWMYYTADVIYTRVIPKFLLTKWFYNWVNQGKSKVLTRAEALGRLYCSGFEVVSEKFINNKLYFAARKIKKPNCSVKKDYRSIIALKRIGKNGQTFNLYKMRTMYAYSEYLQEYVYAKHGSGNGDKANNDFRVTHLGKLFRKLWIDELPSVINIIKGDIKIVGARPLSKAKFKLYPKEVRERRNQFKPGLMPPFYADMPDTFEELLASEMKYFDSYEKNPIWTDFKYFFKVFYNIFFKGARSK